MVRLALRRGGLGRCRSATLPWASADGTHALVGRFHGTVDVTAANIIPSMRYRDAYTAINWLCDVLGFERRLVVPGE